MMVRTDGNSEDADEHDGYRTIHGYIQSMPKSIAHEPVFCFWRIIVLQDFDISFNLKELKITSDNCIKDFFQVQDSQVCFQDDLFSILHQKRSIVIKNDELFTQLVETAAESTANNTSSYSRSSNIQSSSSASSFPNSLSATSPTSSTTPLKAIKKVIKHVNVYLSISEPLPNSSISIQWTHMKFLPENLPSTTESLLYLNKECEFLCKSSRACISKALVCNGFANCPHIESVNQDDDGVDQDGDEFNHDNSDFNEHYSPVDYIPEDEDYAACHQNGFMGFLSTNKFILFVMAISFCTIFSWIVVCLFVHFFRFSSKQKQSF